MATPVLFVHKLRSWEVHRLHQEARRTRDPRYRDRLDAVLLSDEGWKVERIARFFGKSYCTVRVWILDFNRFGFDGLKPGKSPGAPRKIGPDEEACLKIALAKNPLEFGYRFTSWTLPTLSEHLFRSVHVRVSCPVLSRVLRRLGYRYKRPKHTLRHKQNRRKVCQVRRERDAILKKWVAIPNASSSSSKMNANSISIPA